MSLEAWGATISVVVVVLGAWWALRASEGRPSSSDVDPTMLPVGTYWWQLARRSRFAWQWRLYLRAPLGGGRDGLYDEPVDTYSSSTYRLTRTVAMWAVRRAVRRDVRRRGYAASTVRGVVKP